MKRTILHTACLTVLFAFFFIASIQASINIRFRHLSSENGLGANYIRSIVQDPRGYIWMGATTGLIRYDGYTAELITPERTESRKLMLDERVHAVEIWQDRFVWMMVRGFKYCCYDTETDQFIDYTGNGSYAESFRHYYLLQNGDILLSDSKNGCKIVHYDGKAFSSEKREIKELPQETKQTLPAAFQNLLSPGRQLIKDSRGNPVVVSLEGELWHINQKTHQVTRLTDIYSQELRRLNGSPRYSVVTDKDGFIWISTYGNGLFVYNPKTQETTHYLSTGTNITPIQTNYLIKLYEDKAGNIWVCQENMGVAVISKQDANIERVFFTNNEHIDHTNSIHLLSRVGEHVYIGNRFNGLKVADGNMRILKDEGVYHDDIVAVCVDQQGTIWKGTRETGVYAGMLHLHNVKDDPSSLSAGKISDIICDRKGRIWISIFDGDIELAIPDGKGGYSFRHFFTGKDDITHPRKMLIDHGGYLWLCSDEGIFTFDPDRLIANPQAYIHFNIGKDRDAKTNEVHCIFEDSEKYILAGTAGDGTAVFDNRQAGKPRYACDFVSERGSPDNNIHQIIEDEESHLWFGTERGLIRYDRKIKSLMYFLPANTIQGNMFIENATCLLNDGKIAFGSRHGIVIVDSKSIKPHKPLFKLRITEIDINGVSIPQNVQGNLTAMLNGGEGITLSHNENSLTFRFSDFEYNEGLSSKYTYRLVGYDKEWSQLSSDNFATYKNLPSGDYLFEVKAQNSNGEWNEAVVSMPISIRPPMWATWWAYLIYIIIAGGLAYTIYRQLKHTYTLRNRIKMEQQLTEFKMQFFTNISHEFRTPLTIIRGATEHMRSYERIPAELKLPAFSIQKSTERLLRMINQLLEFSKMHENKLQLALEETEVVGFLRDIYSTFKEMADNKHISYLFSTNVKTITTYIDRSFLDKIAYNLISNAFKYTPSHGEITIKLKQEEDKVLFMVEDTGIGIPKDKQKELFERFNQSAFSRDSIGIGLHLTNELVRVHHGTISYEENPKGGSIFIVALPTDKSIYSEQDFMASESALLGSENTETTVLKEYKELAPNPLNDRKVLIVEDDNDVKNFLLNEIQRYFVCQCALDGNEALAKIKEEKPDLIISDVMMPIMSGLELTEKIRQDKDIADIPIILLTALSGEKNLLKGLKNGADAYIEKPFSIAVLIAKCRQLIEQRDRLKNHYAQEKEVKVSKPDILVNEQDKRFKEQLDYWLSNHYHESGLDIDSFAESMGYGRTTFYKRVKRIMGQTPNDYLKSIRMNHAAEMLNDDRLTVAEISYKVGIDDPYYFSKSFKSYFGVSPTQYRKGERAK